MSEPVTVKASIPFLPILTLIFIVLKLTKVIAWSWVWVLSPLWLPIAVVLGLFVIFGVFIGGAKVIDAIRRK